MEKINSQIPEKSEKLNLPFIYNWFWDAKNLYLRYSAYSEMKQLEESLPKGNLPPGFYFQINQEFNDVILMPINMPLIRKGKRLLLSQQRESECLVEGSDIDYCFEPYGQEYSFPKDEDYFFPLNVPVKINQIDAAGDCLAVGSCIPRTLEIEIYLSRENIDEVRWYFGRGLNLDQLHSRLYRLIGDKFWTDRGVWVKLQKIFPNWIAEKANTFPLQEDGADVCYNIAAHFYQDEISQPISFSKENLVQMIERYYKEIGPQDNLKFGDILYSGGHAARFIMKDPWSSKEIVFSLQSGGTTPYRFWWAEEDFNDPFFEEDILKFARPIFPSKVGRYHR